MKDYPVVAVIIPGDFCLCEERWLVFPPKGRQTCCDGTTGEFCQALSIKLALKVWTLHTHTHSWFVCLCQSDVVKPSYPSLCVTTIRDLLLRKSLYRAGGNHVVALPDTCVCVYVCLFAGVFFVFFSVTVCEPSGFWPNTDGSLCCAWCTCDSLSNKSRTCRHIQSQATKTQCFSNPKQSAFYMKPIRKNKKKTALPHQRDTC